MRRGCGKGSLLLLGPQQQPGVAQALSLSLAMEGMPALPHIAMAVNGRLLCPANSLLSGELSWSDTQRCDVSLWTEPLYSRWSRAQLQPCLICSDLLKLQNLNLHLRKMCLANKHILVKHCGILQLFIFNFLGVFLTNQIDHFVDWSVHQILSL